MGLVGPQQPPRHKRSLPPVRAGKHCGNDPGLRRPDSLVGKSFLALSERADRGVGWAAAPSSTVSSKVITLPESSASWLSIRAAYGIWNRPASPRTPGHGAWGRDQAPRREKGESVAYCSSGARVACTTGKVTSCSFRAYVWPAIPTVSHDLPPTALALAAVPWLLSLRL